MSGHLIRVEFEDISFPIDEGQTVLEAAELAGWEMPYACRAGVCNSCSGRVVDGEVVVRGAVRRAGDEVLFCQARARSDLVLTPKAIRKRESRIARRFDATIVEKESLVQGGIIRLNLRLPIGRRLKFRPGDYIRVYIDKFEFRNYSVALGSPDNKLVELHVKVYEGGIFSQKILKMKELGEKIEIEGPYGAFDLESTLGFDLIIAVSGTGYAVVKAILSELSKRKFLGKVWVFWAGRRDEELYAVDELARLGSAISGFKFIPVLSRDSSSLSGARQGHIQDWLFDEVGSLSGKFLYLCGNQSMVESLESKWLAGGGDSSKVFCDSFVSLSQGSFAEGA
ncbi:MAG: FAD-binding oxidoreductase [Comamonadaceae bacterium]|nr:FAD-binding oxidoreductase [Comamonadaceae bacterium]